ncbi:MAG: hypothetical protein WC644_08670 [Ignavibacteria bacterium]
MKEDNNKILNDINNSGGEIAKEEHNIYKKFLEFRSKYKTENEIADKKIIEFIPVKNEEVNYEPDLRLFAAESATGSHDSEMIQSNFYVSTDDKYALKCISIAEDELCVNILSDVNSTQEMILFLPELNKYYLPNVNGEYIISGASAKNLSKVNFKVFLYKEKIKISVSGKSYSLLSVNNLTRPDVIELNTSFLIIKLNGSKNFLKAVMMNDKTREFINYSDDLINVPLLLLDNNSVIYLF